MRVTERGAIDRLERARDGAAPPVPCVAARRAVAAPAGRAEGRGSQQTPGEFQRTQNWIGGTRPGTARFVPPPVPAMHDAGAVAAALGIAVQRDPEPERGRRQRSDHGPLLQVGIPATGVTPCDYALVARVTGQDAAPACKAESPLRR